MALLVLGTNDNDFDEDTISFVLKDVLNDLEVLLA